MLKFLGLLFGLLSVSAVTFSQVTKTARIPGVPFKDWNAPATWSPNGVPASNDLVIIPGGANVYIFSASNTAGSLTINGTGTLSITSDFDTDPMNPVPGILTVGSVTVNGGSLSLGDDLAALSSGDITINGGGITSSGVAGSINTNGNFTVSGSGTFTAGNSTITFSGATKTIDGSVNGTTFNNMVVSGSYTVLNKVNLQATLTVSGTFNANGASGGSTNVFKLLSASVNSTARIAPITGTYTGLTTVERRVLGGLRWQYLSFPFTDANVGDLRTGNHPVTGVFSDRETNPVIIGSSPSDAPSIYSFNSGTALWQSVGGADLTVATTSVPLSNSVGYSTWSYSNSAYTIVYNNKTLSTGPVNVTLSNGFNLIPNPYPSAIDFRNFNSLAGLTGSTMYLQRDGAGNGIGNFASTDGTACANCGSSPFNNSGWKGQIAMGQSFWVNSTGGGTLTFTETMKIASDASTQFLREESAANYVRVSLRSGDMSDEALILFDNTASKRDGQKMLNGTTISGLGRSYINLSSYDDDPSADYVFNYKKLISCSESTKSVSAKLKIADVPLGESQLVFSDLESFDLGYSIKLIDKYLNKSMDVTNNSVYKFDVTSDPASIGVGRFELTFGIAPLKPISPQDLVANFNCTLETFDVKINNVAPGVAYQLFVGNQSVSSIESSVSGTVEFSLDKSKLVIGSNILTARQGSQAGCSLAQFDNVISLNYQPVAKPVITAEGIKLTSSLPNVQWFKDGKLIPGATNATFVAYESGTYKARALYNGCISDSDNLVLLVTGTGESNESMRLFPNPSADRFTLALETEEDAFQSTWQLLDARGVNLTSGVLITIIKNEATFDLSSHPQGIYFLRVNTPTQSRNFRMIKAK